MLLRNVDEALQFVAENDVKFIRLTFCDIFGNQKNISIMPNELPRAFASGMPFEASAVKGFMSEQVAEEAAKMPAELLLFPDYTTLAFLPWRPSSGRVIRIFCDICYPDGRPFPGDGRFMLRQTMQRLEKARLSCRLGTECEFYLLELNDDGTVSRRPQDRAGYLDVAPLDRGEDVRRQICLYLEEMDIKPQQSYHERGPGQNEIDFQAAEPLRAADDLVSFKSVVKTVANYNGLYASMLPKLFAEQYGCGLHVHFSLCRDGRSILAPNILQSDLVGQHFIAGILRRIREITLFLNPLTNSYARFGSFEAPAYISWSDKSRFQLISFPLAGDNSVHMELRSPDACLNPYLAFALLLNAGLEGVEQRLLLAEPQHTENQGADLPEVVLEPERLLLISAEKGQKALIQLLNVSQPGLQISLAVSGADARRILLAQDFDFVLINAPLLDENGQDLAGLAAGRNSGGVLLLLKSERLSLVQPRLEEQGIIVLPKPLNRAALTEAVALVRIMNRRLRRLRAVNLRQRQKLEELRLVSRAKCLLIANCGFSEEQAHDSIEKTAMNRRITKLQLAEDIVKKYSKA